MGALWLKLGLGAAVAAVLAGAVWKVYDMGREDCESRWALERAEMAAAHDKEVARLEKANREVVVKYLYRDRYLEGQTKTIVKEVPVYVTAEDDDQCDIPDGFMLVRHAAIEGNLPTDYRRSDFVGAGDTVALSDISVNEVENFGACNRNAEKLIALQDLVKRFMEQSNVE